MLKIYKVKCKIQLNKKLTTYLMKNQSNLPEKGESAFKKYLMTEYLTIWWANYSTDMVQQHERIWH